jgi:hypothetical protein
MAHVWTTFGAAALIGALGSMLAQAGTRDQSRMADLIAALVTGCFFGTFALFMGRWVLLAEGVFAAFWAVWARVQRQRPRAPHGEPGSEA